MIPDIKLPSLSEVSDKQNLEKIRGYLATLHDQLRYIMLNVDTDNLSDGLSSTISSAYGNAEDALKGIGELKSELSDTNGKVSTVTQTADELKAALSDTDGKVSAVTQTADKINWVIADGTDSTNFTLTSRAATLVADSIDLSGHVKFTDLAESGSTVIDGSNLVSGTVSADKLSVTDLSAVAAKIGGWTLSQSSISSTDGAAGVYLNSAASQSPYWLQAVSSWGYTTFYIAKNGTCYIDGSYISDGSITANKITCDAESRLDLTNNYNGVKLGSELLITNGINNCKLFVNNQGILTFDTGTGDASFSFALRRNGTVYSLDVLNGSGQTVGTLSL